MLPNKDISDKRLLWALKVKRRRLAKEKNIPPYMIFQNSTLDGLVIMRPHNKDELSCVFGLGEHKIAEYGEEILKFIADPIGELKREKRMKRVRSLYPQLVRTKIKLIRRKTLAEKKFIEYLKELNIEYRFQKGFVTKHFTRFRVVDFYIPRAKLVFEIDGDYHNTIQQEINDEKRTGEIHERRPNLLFVRFQNKEIISEPAKVKRIVLEVFNSRYRAKKDNL